MGDDHVFVAIVFLDDAEFGAVGPALQMKRARISISGFTAMKN